MLTVASAHFRLEKQERAGASWRWKWRSRSIYNVAAIEHACSLLQRLESALLFAHDHATSCCLQVLNLKKEEEDKRKLEMEVEMLQHEFDRRHGDGARSSEDGHPKPSGSGQPPSILLDEAVGVPGIVV